MQKKLQFRQVRETKGTFVFHETDAKGVVLQEGFVIGQVYVRKDQLKSTFGRAEAPESFTMTIELPALKSVAA